MHLITNILSLTLLQVFTKPQSQSVLSVNVTCVILCVSHKGRVLVETGLGELFEALGEISL